MAGTPPLSSDNSLSSRTERAKVAQRRAWWTLALVLLAASHGVIWHGSLECADRRAPGMRVLSVAAMSDGGPIADQSRSAHVVPPGVPAPEGDLDSAPVRRSLIPGRAGEQIIDLLRRLPWWAALLAVALAAAHWEIATLVGVGVLVAATEINFGVGVAGLALAGVGQSARGWMLGRRRRAHAWRSRFARRAGAPRITAGDWGRRTARRPIRTGFLWRFIPGWHRAGAIASGAYRRTQARHFAASSIASLLFALGGLIVATVAASWIVLPLHERVGAAGLVIGAALVFVVLRTCRLLVTWTGRQMLKAAIARAVRFEFWPSWALYALLLPHLARLSWRYRHPLAFTCCNPGIENGGGMIGESKMTILESLRSSDQWMLPAVRIEPLDDPDRRTDAALRQIRAHPGLANAGDPFPIILKPDSGYRGFAVKLIRDAADMRDYFASMTRAAIAQAYHPGPHECGLLWVRRPRHSQDTPQSVHAARTSVGFIFSITRKEFPAITGDGRRTLEELIYAHPRYRCQAPVFLERFADDRSRVLARGETLRLAVAGNHCQGTLFGDGAPLATPALAARIDQIARAFAAGRPGSELDFGRFDLRYESEDLLRAGEGFGIVELNGTSSESTNIYDPERSLAWAYGVLARQWSLLFALGAERREAGARPMSVRELITRYRAHLRARPGSPVAD